MSHTHFLYHIVFGTKDRMPLIDTEWERRLYAHMGGIVKNFNGIVLEINGMPDHLHLLIRLGPDLRVLRMSTRPFFESMGSNSTTNIFGIESFACVTHFGGFFSCVYRFRVAPPVAIKLSRATHAEGLVEEPTA